MTLKRRFEALIIQNPKLALDALAELGYVQPKKTREYEFAREIGLKMGVKDGMERALAIIKACREGGLDLQQAEKMINEGMDLNAAMETIARLRAWDDVQNSFTGKFKPTKNINH